MAPKSSPYKYLTGLHQDGEIPTIELEAVKMESTNAQLECSAADERAKILASEVIGLEEKALRLRSNELKLEKQLENLNAEIGSYKRRLSSLEKERYDFQSTIEALQEDTCMSKLHSSGAEWFFIFAEKKLLLSKVLLLKQLVPDHYLLTSKRPYCFQFSKSESEAVQPLLHHFPSSMEDALLEIIGNEKWLCLLEISLSGPFLLFLKRSILVIFSEIEDSTLIDGGDSMEMMSSPAVDTLQSNDRQTGKLFVQDAPGMIPPEQLRTIDNINSLISELALEKEELIRALRVQSTDYSKLKVDTNKELSQKLETQTQRLEFLAAQHMASESMLARPLHAQSIPETTGYTDEGDESLGLDNELFPGGPSKRRTSKLL
ncbi:unnamed protein product [Spirodela intermedia]|uniref:Uncharacterized protein n=1 Tax=Spirodela intermedia TaxID=51605 RepID=A0A7I8IHG3_SPIIN|nr:unnamed protein product [Spirodela intermedia]CAA6657164.1 unnamed protein product [Spirodela intermedia]